MQSLLDERANGENGGHPALSAASLHRNAVSTPTAAHTSGAKARKSRASPAAPARVLKHSRPDVRPDILCLTVLVAAGGVAGIGCGTGQRCAVTAVNAGVLAEPIESSGSHARPVPQQQNTALTAIL